MFRLIIIDYLSTPAFDYNSVSANICKFYFNVEHIKKDCKSDLIDYLTNRINFKDEYIIIHLITHGGISGICPTQNINDVNFIEWETILNLFKPIKTNNKVVILNFMSVCNSNACLNYLNASYCDQIGYTNTETENLYDPFSIYLFTFLNESFNNFIESVDSSMYDFEQF